MVLQTWAVVCAGMLIVATGCKPDESPFRTENETLRKQLAKQESVVTSLQDGNRVMQQQIDLLNQELRDAKKAVDSTKAEARAAIDSMESQLNLAKRLTVEAQKTAAAQAAQSIHVDGKGAQADDIPRPLATVAKVVEESLGRNGYQLRVSIKTDQKAVFVTDRKVSNPTSLEVAGFRNQYVISIYTLPANVTRLVVKADFEKLAQGGKILSVSAEEVTEIERRLIAEVNKALAASNKT